MSNLPKMHSKIHFLCFQTNVIAICVNEIKLKVLKDLHWFEVFVIIYIPMEFFVVLYIPTTDTLLKYFSYSSFEG